MTKFTEICKSVTNGLKPTISCNVWRHYESACVWNAEICPEMKIFITIGIHLGFKLE